MVEIPKYIVKEHLSVRQGTEHSHHEYRLLNTLIRENLPEAQIESLEDAEIAQLKATFLLLKDFAQRNWRAQLSRNGTENLVLTLRGPDTPSSKVQIREDMLPRRLELIRQSANWIRRVEPEMTKYLVDGDEVDPTHIKPELEECTTQLQMDLFRYCRYLSSVPYSEYVGRRMRFLVRDGSLPTRPIIGIAALGSSLMQIKCRDEWIGWYGPKLRNIKKLRIAHMMDLYVAVAVPPYSDLLGGKLVCYMMASDEVREAFRQKYELTPTTGKGRIVKDLVLLTTTSVYGKHSSQYNRIRYEGRLLYKLVGETVGFGTLHISKDTFSALRAYLSTNGIELGHEFGDGANWRLRTVREAMDRLGFDAEECLRHGHSRGVYVVPLAKNARKFLRGETDEIEYYENPLSDLVAHWRTRWLEKRAMNNDILQRVRDFRSETLRLTPLLD